MTKPAPPLIGITTYGRDGENRFTLPAEYVDGVRRAGGLPLLIPPGETQFDQLLPHLDGLILAGGGDIAPELYGGQWHPKLTIPPKAPGILRPFGFAQGRLFGLRMT